jgi:DNA replication and repair protein RecF
LLDEVAAHLDTVRRGELFDRLSQAGGQVWMTGTDRAFFAGLDVTAARFSLSDAKIEAG